MAGKTRAILIAMMNHLPTMTRGGGLSAPLRVLGQKLCALLDQVYDLAGSVGRDLHRPHPLPIDLDPRCKVTI